MLLHLSKCRFPSLDRLLLLFGRLDADDMDALSPFFSMHPHIRALTLPFLPISFSLSMGFPCRVAEIAFYLSVPPASILAHLGEATHTLILSEYEPGSENRALWTLLDALIASAPRLAVRTLRFEMLPMYQWVLGLAEEQTFLDELASYTSKLQRVGVKIVNQQGWHY